MTNRHNDIPHQTHWPFQLIKSQGTCDNKCCITTIRCWKAKVSVMYEGSFQEKNFQRIPNASKKRWASPAKNLMGSKEKIELDCVDPWWSQQSTGLKLIQRRSRPLGKMINFEYSIIYHYLFVGDTDTVDGWNWASNITFSHLCTSRDLNKLYLLDMG